MPHALSPEYVQPEDVQIDHPIKLASALVVRHDWFFRQAYEDALLVDVPGRFGQYQLHLDWNVASQTLYARCALELEVPVNKLAQIALSLMVLNEDLSLGHFLLTSDTHEIQLRYALSLQGAGGATAQQIDDVVHVIVEQAELASSALYQLLRSSQTQPHMTRLAMMTVAGEA